MKVTVDLEPVTILAQPVERTTTSSIGNVRIVIPLFLFVLHPEMYMAFNALY